MSTATALPNSVKDLAALAMAWQSPSTQWQEALRRAQGNYFPSPLVGEGRGEGSLSARVALKELLNVPVGDLAGEHNRLFGSSGTCPLDLAHFWTDNPFQQAARLADLAGFYKAFGVEVEEGVRPDALPAVLELVSWLVFKRQYALDQGWSERADISSRALQTLLTGFVHPAFEGFERRLEEASAWPMYCLLYQVTKTYLHAIQTEVGNHAANV